MAKSYGMVGGQSGNPPDSYTITPTTTNQIIPSDTMLEQSLIVKGDANLVESNIKTGVDLFNKVGTFNSFDASTQNNVAFLASDNYATEYTITNFSDLNITETAISGTTASEEYQLVSGINNSRFSFGAKYMYTFEQTVGSSGEYESYKVNCYDKTTKNLISSIDLSQYLHYGKAYWEACVVNYQNIDSLCIIITCQDGTYPNYLVVIRNTSLGNAINLGGGVSSSFATTPSINYSINGAFVMCGYLMVDTSENLHAVAYDTLNNIILYHKIITLSSSPITGTETISVFRPSSVQYNTITNNIGSFSYFYTIYTTRSNINISKFSIADGTLISTVAGFSLPVASSSTEVPKSIGITVDTLNSAEQFVYAYSFTSPSATYVFRHSLSSSSGSNIWQKTMSASGASSNSSGSGLSWDRYVNTLYLPIDLALYKLKATNGNAMFTTDLYASNMDIYTHTYYSSAPTNKRCVDTSISATRTITTDTFTATIEEV